LPTLRLRLREELRLRITTNECTNSDYRCGCDERLQELPAFVCHDHVLLNL
jgi:hypothetical protein